MVNSILLTRVFITDRDR